MKFWGTIDIGDNGSIVRGRMIKIEEKNAHYRRYYAVKHMDDGIRLNSTSGGMFTAISDYVLNREGVVYGAVMGEELKVFHCRAVTREERDRMRGSKYVQSILGDSYALVKKDLEAGRMVLFTGTPCQVDGLKRYLDGTDISGLILSDVICFGTPRREIWLDYVKFLEKKKHKKLRIHYFRSKVNGWHTVTSKNIYADNTEDYKSVASQLFMNLINSGMILLPSCYHCKYASTNRFSDFTIGDFWKIKSFDPNFDDNKGVSMVIVNSEKADSILGVLRKELHLKECNLNDCIQHNLEEPTPLPVGHDQFLEDYRNKGFRYIAKKYGGYTLKNRIRGTLSRHIKRYKIYPFLRKLLRR